MSRLPVVLARFLVVLALALAGARPALAQEPAAPPPAEAPADEGEPAPSPSPADVDVRKRGEALTVYVLTFSPGDHPFFKFGHNAIWIHDELADRYRDKVYNWGTFSFGDPALIPKFVVGRFMYWLSAQGLGMTKGVYRRENRWVDAQELDLTPEQRVKLRDAVEENLRPEKKHYKYDYYRDNCSTRVRDHVDAITDGELRKVADGAGRLTWRQHTMRVTADTPFFATVLSLAMADLIDKPTTKWEEAFLPGELQKTMREVKMKAPDGTLRPLVKSEQRLVEANRPDPPFEPPTWLHWFLLIGAALAAWVLGMGRLWQRGSRGARIAFGVSFAGASLLLGFLGLFFAFVWFGTDHGAGYGNENMFVCTPFAWALVPSAIGIARGKPAAVSRAAKIALVAAGLAVLGLVVKVLPWFDQQNGWFLAMFIPPWVATAWVLRTMAAAPSVTPPEADPPKSPPARNKEKVKKSKPAEPTPEPA